MPKIWTEPDDTILRTMWLNGEKPKAIADRLNVTKNSVLGRARRIKLPKHTDSNDKRKERSALRPHRAYEREAPKTLDQTVIEWRSIPRARGCQYIEGDPREVHTKCGAPIKQGSRFSFCDEHHARCFRKPATKPADEFVIRKSWRA